MVRKHFTKIVLLVLAPIFVNAQTLKPTQPAGELQQSIQLAFDRLNTKAFMPVFTEAFILADVNIQPENPRRFFNFSGDLSGRYIEVMSMNQAHKASVDLHSLVLKVLTFQQPDGRFGDKNLVYEEKQIGKQHMALLWGNGRLLVGLLEYYKHYKNENVLAAAKKLGDFFLNTYSACAAPAISKKLEGMGATGIICFTQYIEGLVMLSEFTGSSRYAAIAAKTYQILPERGVQHSHGYLTTLRGVLALYQYDHNINHLNYVKRNFDELLASNDFTAFGSVLEYFGKKAVNRDEGCSTADFVRLCFDLYKATNQQGYLEKGEFALLNSLFFNQYYTGDFGHHIIGATGADPHYEHTAWWCCTMHGLRAMYDVAQKHVLVNSGGAANLNLYQEGAYSSEKHSIVVTKGEFKDGYHFFILKPGSNTEKLLLRIPGWAADSQILLNGKVINPELKDNRAVLTNLKITDVISIGFSYKKTIVTASDQVALEKIGTDVVKGLLHYGPYLMGVDDKIDHTFTAEPNDNTIYARTVQPLGENLRLKGGFRKSYDLDNYLVANYKHGGFPSYLQTILRPVGELKKDKHGYLMLGLGFSNGEISDKNAESMLEPWKAAADTNSNTMIKMNIKKNDMTDEKLFQVETESSWTDLGSGLKRKVFGYDDHLMLVKVKFEAGAVGTVHQHVHSQASYVESGVFELMIGGKKKTLRAGDGYFVPSNEAHGCVCIEPGVLVDAFSPARQDFLTTK